jgi:hypothetical protein
MAHGRKPPRRAIGKTELAMRNPVWGADKRAPMPQGKQLDLLVAASDAFDHIVHGRCRDGDPDSLAVVVNVATVLCEWDFGAEYAERVRLAMDALLHAQNRANRGQAFNFDGPGRLAWTDVLELFEQQIGLAGHLEVMRALATVSDRIRKGDVVRAEFPA